jgi:uncharacterized membrane protein
MKTNNKWFNFVAKTPWILWILLAGLTEAGNIAVFGGLGVLFDEHHHHILSNISGFICYGLFGVSSYLMFELKEKVNKKVKLQKEGIKAEERL